MKVKKYAQKTTQNYTSLTLKAPLTRFATMQQNRKQSKICFFLQIKFFNK